MRDRTEIAVGLFYGWLAIETCKWVLAILIALLQFWISKVVVG